MSCTGCCLPAIHIRSLCVCGGGARGCGGGRSGCGSRSGGCCRGSCGSGKTLKKKKIKFQAHIPKQILHTLCTVYYLDTFTSVIPQIGMSSILFQTHSKFYY